MRYLTKGSNRIAHLGVIHAVPGDQSRSRRPALCGTTPGQKRAWHASGIESGDPRGHEKVTCVRCQRKLTVGDVLPCTQVLYSWQTEMGPVRHYQIEVLVRGEKVRRTGRVTGAATALFEALDDQWSIDPGRRQANLSVLLDLLSDHPELADGLEPALVRDAVECVRSLNGFFVQSDVKRRKVGG